jgi:hypothetical protein
MTCFRKKIRVYDKRPPPAVPGPRSRNFITPLASLTWMRRPTSVIGGEADRARTSPALAPPRKRSALRSVPALGSDSLVAIIRDLLTLATNSLRLVPIWSLDLE